MGERGFSCGHQIRLNDVLLLGSPVANWPTIGFIGAKSKADGRRGWRNSGRWRLDSESTTSSLGNWGYSIWVWHTNWGTVLLTTIKFCWVRSETKIHMTYIKNTCWTDFFKYWHFVSGFINGIKNYSNSSHLSPKYPLRYALRRKKK